MATNMWIIANMTNYAAKLLDVQTGQPYPLPANSLVHTGGTDNNFIEIPACSGSQYYAAHHILVNFGGWSVAFWNNDDQDNILYWSAGDFYSEQNPIPNSGNAQYEDCMILIQGTSGKDATVTSFKYD